MDWAKLLEIIQKALEQPLFTLNETPVTVSSIAAFCLIMGGFLLLARIVSRIVGRVLAQRSVIDVGTRFTLVRLIQYTIVILGGIIAFQFIGIDLSGLAVIFGLLSVGIGFGLQNLTSNFISGLILLIERPIKVGDRVTIGDTEGDVIEINMRSTTILSLRNISIIVPNSEFITSTVINWSHGDPRVALPIEENPDVLEDPAPAVSHRGFGDSAWDMRLSVWVADPKLHYTVRSDLHCAIVHKFRENGIEIPYPQRDLHLRSSIPFPAVASQQ